MLDTAATDPAGRLRACGLRVTAPRVTTMAVLADNPHSDADWLARAVRERLGAVSTQAVYDVLRALTAVGIARRFEPAGSTSRYELRVGDNHHHLVCRGCGDIRDVDCAVGHAPCLSAVDDHGFAIDEAEVTYWGLCPGCAGLDPPAAPRPTSHPSPDHEEQT